MQEHTKFKIMIIKPLPEESKILNALLEKADLKRSVFHYTIDAFQLIKKEVREVTEWIKLQIEKKGKQIDVHYKENGEFELEIKFAGDTLFFIMHTNVFTFSPEHFIFKTNYVKEDPTRAFCGTILIYNFLSDSIKFNRMNDVGYLLGRIFINKEGHYFMQGKRQYSFLHRDFSSLIFNEEAVRDIVEIAITQAVDFDLFVPPIENIQEISLIDKINSVGSPAIRTGKRLGFDLDLHEKDSDLSMLLE